MATGEGEGKCYLGKEEAHDVLERGEDAVLEYLKGEGWTGLEVHNNKVLPPPEGERGIFMAGAVVTGEKGKTVTRF